MTRTSTTTGAPGFLADTYHFRRDTGHPVDWDAVGNEFRATPGVLAFEVEVTANAAADATAVAVVALPGPIPSGTVLDFGGDKFARLTADSPAGDTSLAVSALTTALVDGDTADYAGTAGSGSKMLPAGTIVAIVSGKIVPATDDTADGILFSNASEDSRSDSLTGYGVLRGGHIYENLLPDADPATGDIPAAAKTALGALFTWQDYTDTRLS